MDLVAQLTAYFKQQWGQAPEFVARAPGRVNLLGEHVDYNDGWVLPAAIDRATYVAVRRQAAAAVSLAALDLDETATFSLETPATRPAASWACYPAGVAWALQARGLATSGLQAAYTSSVPRGSGLSSSASVEVAFATAWQKLGGWTLPPMELARLCQRAENKYVGVNCGIMDQFASACGQAGQVLLLDCRTLTWEPVPLPPGLALVIADTRVRRELGNSAYNERRAQCEAAVRYLATRVPGVRALRDVSVTDFNRYAAGLPETVARRARHVVEECARTQLGVAYLRAGDAAGFGALMNACHISLRDLYEVSCPELDAMVTAAQSLPGCYGARLTGAGFGGCTVNLVAAETADEFSRALATRYARATGLQAEIYVCQASAGAQIVA